VRMEAWDDDEVFWTMAEDLIRRYAHPHSWRNEFQVPLNALLVPTRHAVSSALDK